MRDGRDDLRKVMCKKVDVEKWLSGRSRWDNRWCCEKNANGKWEIKVSSSFSHSPASLSWNGNLRHSLNSIMRYSLRECFFSAFRADLWGGNPQNFPLDLILAIWRFWNVFTAAKLENRRLHCRLKWGSRWKSVSSHARLMLMGYLYLFSLPSAKINIKNSPFVRCFPFCEKRKKRFINFPSNNPSFWFEEQWKGCRTNISKGDAVLKANNILALTSWYYLRRECWQYK